MTVEPAAPAPPSSTRTAPRGELRGWYFYDWACSAFNTTVVTVFLGPLLTDVTEVAADPEGFVHPFGIAVRAEAFFPSVVSLSVVLQVLVLPLVGGIADRTQRKKPMLALFAYVGAFATMGLYFLDGERYLLGGGLFVLANIAFGAALVVYNAFLPELAAPDDRDGVSASGWAFGYLGGGLLLALNLVLYASRDAIGVSEGDAARISILSAGVWWALFTLVPLKRLRTSRSSTSGEPNLDEQGVRVVSGGFRQLAGTLREIRGFPQTLLFLAAYLLFNDGIQTVIALSATFGTEELGLAQQTLIIAILVVQFVAFGGALLFGRLALRFGAKRLILASIVVWTVVVTAAYFLPERRALPFFALAIGIGLVLGGSQALSRSLFSQMIPRGKEAEYFGLYEISERGTSWLGTALFALALQVTGSYRVAIISLVVFFVLGFAVLSRVDVRRAISEAGNVVPARV